MQSPIKRLLPVRRFLAALAAGSLLAGCAAPARNIDVRQAASAMASSQPGVELYEAGPADTNFAVLLERVYGLDPETVQDGSILYSQGVSASEIAVLEFEDAQAAADAAASLEAYAKRRAADFTGYAPDQEQIAASAQIVQDGNVVMLMMLPEPDAARQAAEPYFSAEASASLPSAEPETPSPSARGTLPTEGYDHDAVLAAYASSDPSGLSEENRQVYDIVRSVIQTVTSPDMSSYEKELAIHDWMTANIQYDPAELEHPLIGAVPSPENDNPIGALLYGKSICYGYSSTFQLFMDALGIPCITIDGEANEPGNAHSWNAVELDGQWYYVDVTWDDPVTGFPDHDYLNQTTAYLEAHGPHIWDREGLPEIAAEPYSPS